MGETEGVVLRAALLLVISGLAVTSELRTRHIPNAITPGGLVAALFVAAFTGHFLDSLGGLVIVAVPFLFAFWRMWLHGGGVKLALALGASVGLVGAPVIVFGPGLAFAVARAFESRGPLVARAGRSSSPWLTWFAALGFAMSVWKQLAG